jgi:hypothetical protein
MSRADHPADYTISTLAQLRPGFPQSSAAAALRALQKSLTTGVGTGEFAARWVNRIPVLRYGGWSAT